MEPIDPRITVIARAAWRGLEVTLSRAEPGRYEAAPSPDHRIMVHLGGPARVTCCARGGRRTWLQKRGDIDVIPAGWTPVFEDDDPTSLLGIRIESEFVDGIVDCAAREPWRSLAEPRIHERDERIFALARLLELELAAPSDPLWGDSLAAALATRLVARFGDAAPRRPGARMSRPKLARVLDFIESHLGEAIRLVELADLAGVSPSHFRALFCSSMGRPVHRYVLERRALEARRLLETTDLSITQAALECGFCHASHMAREMSRTLGIAPSKVRRDRTTSLVQ
ncbi:MAG: helix-turn-helix domain-containing protein [Caulobacteraceae bacterium]